MPRTRTYILDGDREDAILCDIEMHATTAPWIQITVGKHDLGSTVQVGPTVAGWHPTWTRHDVVLVLRYHVRWSCSSLDSQRYVHTYHAGLQLGIKVPRRHPKHVVWRAILPHGHHHLSAGLVVPPATRRRPSICLPDESRTIKHGAQLTRQDHVV